MERGQVVGRSCRSSRCCNSYTHGCPCGHYGDGARACTCPEAAVSRYRKRLSGPLLDRIDYHKLSGDGLAEPSTGVRARVEAARGRQWWANLAEPLVTP